MKPKIKRTKQPEIKQFDVLEYESNNFYIYSNSFGEIVVTNRKKNYVFLTPTQAKELSKVLPKFLEEMEKGVSE